MTLDKAHLVVGLISAVVSVIASFLVYAVAFGEMRSDVRHLQKKVVSLENTLADSKIGQSPSKEGQPQHSHQHHPHRNASSLHRSSPQGPLWPSIREER